MCLLSCLLLPRRRHCWLMDPFLLVLRSYLLLIFGVRVALMCLCSRSALCPSVFFMHHIQTRNQPASSLVITKVLHHQSKVSRKYVAKNALLARSTKPASSLVTVEVSHHQVKVSRKHVFKKCSASSQLMPREARHLRLVYIYIYIYVYI